jgi:uncharacterized protein YgiM (DUF1202 family)
VPVAVRAETVTVVRADPTLERQLAEAQLRLLEQDALIESLEELVDEAQREVVRSLAKLQTSASRAEAASAMAEAELAVQTLRRAGRVDVSRAERLLSESAGEFNQANYGGAIYLANQVKNVAGQRASAAPDQVRPGETAFARPVTLTTSARANVREGPGTNFRILLEAGVSLKGQSHATGWIHITDDQGRTGWISQALVSGR